MNLRSVHIFAILLVGMMLSTTSFSQKMQKEDKKLRKKADALIRKGRLNEARTYYEKLVTKEFSDPEIYLEAGICIFKTNIKIEESLPLFEKALTLSTTDTIPELLLYLGKANHYVGNFERGLTFFNLFRNQILSDTKSGSAILSDVDRSIENCNNGIELQTVPKTRETTIKELDSNVNSKVNDFVPLLNDQMDLLIFCSKRPDKEKIDLDEEYFENIYFSKKQNDQWSKSELLHKSNSYEELELNKIKGHVAPISISPDGKTLFIYENGNVLKSTIDANGLWSLPKKMKANVNIGEFNPSVYMSPDSSELYIVSVKNFEEMAKPIDKTADFGRKDIYFSKRMSDGTWSEPIRLGNHINTPYDEDAPFITRDGKTLYFASTGHNSIGGYDIFKSEKDENGMWSKPVNVGTPLNSAGDDIYYIEYDNGTIGFFASKRENGTGHLDIYSAEFECINIPKTEINGYAVLAHNGKPISGKVKLINKETGEEYGEFLIDGATGKYQMNVPPENTYLLELVVDGMEQARPHREEIVIPKQCENYHLFQQITMDFVLDKSNEKIAQRATFKNAFMDIYSESKKFFETDELAFDNNSLQTSTQTGYNMYGNLKHNEMLKADKITVMLANENYEIIRTTTCTDNGEFYFEDLEKDKTYKLILDEESSKISMNGDSKLNSESKLLLSGSVKFIEKDFKFAGSDIECLLANPNKKYTNISISDKSGNFEFKSADQQKIDQYNAEKGLKYNYDIKTPEVAYTAYIQHLDPDNNEVNYSEYIDIIDLKKTDIPEDLKKDFANLLFDFDKFFLRAKSKNVLDNLKAYLEANQNVNIQLGGHADHIGTNEYNMGLSKRRAESAFTYLVKAGVSENRLSSIWFGEEKPVAANTNTDGSDNPEGRQLNRRVEIHVTMPEVGQVILSLR
ncbi:MAG: OmpA family protein [Crocinitomicaceae bacterium]|nr:OmpA family protein [Crocinitomicaceae bacterium]